MKNLLLMRHGKSSWKDDSLEDHERPLKKRGRRDSKLIAKVLNKQNLIPDLILSSSATRAKETAEIVAENLKKKTNILFIKELYMGEPQDYLNALSEISDDVESVMIVAHNPGLEAYLQIIDGEIESVPTAGLGHLVLAVDHWKDVSFETMGDLVGFWRPKDLEEKKK